MKIKIFITVALLISSLPLLAQDAGPTAPAASPSDQLQQLTAQLQNSPDDEALRGRIIALVLTLNPKPATPDAVTMAEGAAEYAFKNGKVNSDFSDAAKQYEKALLLAPWLASDYFNCGVAHEKAGENNEAIRCFKFYLLAAPDSDDAQAVKKRIGGLQYAEQKQISDAAAKQVEENSPESQLKNFINSLDGGVWRCEHSHHERNHNGAINVDLDAGNKYIVINRHTAINYPSRAYLHTGNDGFDPSSQPYWTANIKGHKFNPPQTQFKDELTISDDGQLITEIITTSDSRGEYSETLNYVRIKQKF